MSKDWFSFCEFSTIIKAEFSNSRFFKLEFDTLVLIACFSKSMYVVCARLHFYDTIQEMGVLECCCMWVKGMGPFSIKKSGPLLYKKEWIVCASLS